MRKIKFRAWDKKRRMLFDVWQLIWNEDGGLKLVKVVSLDNVIENSLEDINLLQFTGLKDKNNKEIYEGDIVKHRPTFSELEGKYHIGEIKIEPSRGICVNNIPLAFEPEVIGNIYENPELLRKQERRNEKISISCPSCR